MIQNTTLFDGLVILEMANNHMGDVEHGLRIIRDFHKVVSQFDFKVAIKFQYRHLDTFIHPDYKQRTDIKYVKRFMETRLSPDDFLRMKEEARNLGYLTVCTAFDEESVDLVVKHDYDFIKIASCSFNDWPLLEKIAAADKPVIASTGGATLAALDNVVAFWEHRKPPFALMHCVGSYPTPDSELELNQIDFFRNRYPGVSVGFSTHEEPSHTDPVKLAVAKGAVILERHIGISTERYAINAYSSTPEQIDKWLEAATQARSMCGCVGRRRDISEKEAADLRGLQRGLFVNRACRAGEVLKRSDLLMAIPNQPGQIVANEWSKYMQITLKKDLPANAPVLSGEVEIVNRRSQVLAIIRRLCELMKDANLKLQDQLDLELSHHFGLDRFDEVGCSIITCVNREYCKKIILLLPGQMNPTHWHKQKEETFHILYGTLQLTLGDQTREYNAGDIVVVERGVPHSFSSRDGAALEEISTTHFKNDSFYADANIRPTAERKTYMTFHSDWLTKEIV